MASPLRLEFAGALYHVTARRNDRRAIFLGELETDRSAFLDTLEQTVERFIWVCHAYCLMANHNMMYSLGSVPFGRTHPGTQFWLHSRGPIYVNQSFREISACRRIRASRAGAMSPRWGLGRVSRNSPFIMNRCLLTE